MPTTNKKVDSQTVFRFKVDKSLLRRFEKAAKADNRTIASLLRAAMVMVCNGRNV